MQQDFLTDGIQIHEVDVMPYAGMQVKTDYTVAAATGLYTSATVPDLRDDINVDGIPTWFRWEDPDDTIAFNSSVPAAFLTPGVNQSSPQQCMAYACCYVWNNSGEVLPVHIGCGSDDSIAIILRDEYVWVHSIPRGWGAPREIQDLVTAMPNGDPIILMPGENRLMVKVFEGTGGWGFRLRFQDERGEPILPPTIGVKLRPIPASVPILRSFSSAAYTPGDTVRVALTLSGVKDPPPAAVKIMETLPLGWTATTASDSGIIQGQTITWNLTGAAIANGRRLAYEVPAPKGITAIFKGTYEVEADQFPVTGATTLPRAPIPAENLSPWIAADIGTPLAGGQEKISDTSFNIWGGGADISSRSDSFRFIHRSSTGGDMTMWVRVEGQDATGAGAKAGLMVRQSLEPGSPFYFVQVTPKDGAGPRYRTSLNGNAGPALPISAEADLPLWLKLVRKSNSFTAFTSTDGTTWEQNFRTATHKNPRAITMTEPVLVGFAVTAGDAAKVSGVMFRDFHCDAPFCGDGPLGVFHRGDVDGTGGLTIGDAIFLLNYQFAGGAVPPCLDACDTDDSGSLTIGDPIYLLGYMFAGGPAPPAPGPPGSPCGRDLTGVPLGCESYPPAACQ